MKRVLCLGAGLVARPYVQYLSGRGYHVTVASRTEKKAEKLIRECANTEAVRFDISKDDELLNKLISEADLVCSLLPYTFHVKAAKVALKYGKHFCTTSYISEDMQNLDAPAKEAGVLLLNECGVDPGIDHMSAMKIIDDAHENGGEIISFTSFTGGLPAPDANNNPFGYKLSWSPRGVLLAGRNDAHFLKDGEEVTISGKDLFDNCRIIEVPGMGQFEGYPNRDSMSYIRIYDIPETQTMLRGTYRNVGWCSTLKKIADLGLLSLNEESFKGVTYSQMLRDAIGSDEGNIRLAVAKEIDVDSDSPILDRLEWLGLFSGIKIPEDIDTRLDALCHLFVDKMQYAPGERDMIIMHHEFVIQYPDRKEKVTSTLVDYGIPDGDSSMSRTVALPVAIASRMILEGTIDVTGVHRPVIPNFYNPILDELEELGIEFEEKRSVIDTET